MEEVLTELESDVTEEPEIYPEATLSPAETVDSDLLELQGEFSELCEIESITELNNPTRYAALRDLGLSPREAYLATRARPQIQDNRSHLTSGVPISAAAPGSKMSKSQMAEARELFRGLSDSEIHSLYKKVTK